MNNVMDESMPDLYQQNQDVLNASIDRDMQLNEVCALIPYVIHEDEKWNRDLWISCISIFQYLSSKSSYIFPMMALVCVSSTSVSPQLLQLCCMVTFERRGLKGIRMEIGRLFAQTCLTPPWMNQKKDRKTRRVHRRVSLRFWTPDKHHCITGEKVA